MSEVRRVVLFGPESTGKSVLAEKLATHFGEPWVPEFVRGFWDSRRGVITSSDLDTIARGQMETEDLAVSRAKRVLFCDTDLITNVLWADLLFPGHCPMWLRGAAEERSRQYSLYLFCDTDIPFVADPQRSFPDPADRERYRRLWRQTLVKGNLPFVEIQGDWAQREATAIATIEAVLAC